MRLKKIKRTSFLLVFLATMTGPVGTAFAAMAEFGLKAMSMGEAFTALSHDGSALYYNPAGITRRKRMSISTQYLIDEYSMPDVKGTTYDLSIIDSLTGGGIYGGGFGWMHSDLEVPGSDLARDTYSVAAAYMIGGIFDFGFTQRYTTVKDGAIDRSQWSTDIGLMIGTQDQTLLIGAVIHNAFRKNDGADPNANDPGELFAALPRRIRWGAASILGDVFTLSYDGLYDMDKKEGGKIRHSIGAELLFVAVGIAARGGYIWDNITEHSYYTWGVGLVAPKMSMGFAMKQDPGRVADHSIMFEITVSVGGG